MVWYAKTNGSWATVSDPRSKSVSAWNPVQEGWVRHQGVWQRFYYRDTTAPTAPTLEITELADRFVVQVTATSTNTASFDLVIQDQNNTDLSDPNRSIVITDVPLTIDSPAVYEWMIAPVPDHYYQFKVTAYSQSGTPSNTTVYGYQVDPVTNYYQTYINPVGTDNWEFNSIGFGVNVWGALGGSWNSSNNDVIQGGSPLKAGYWFYGQRWGVLLGKKITLMQIQIGRRNTTHGVFGKANVWLAHHEDKNKPTNASELKDSVKVGTLQRGETAWFTVPSSWYSSISNDRGQYQGLGLYTSNMGNSTSDYIRSFADSDGVGNGRLYVEYHD